jgi:putative toxin-antitoxin system antitoxin component (TIGR02293 family)
LKGYVATKPEKLKMTGQKLSVGSAVHSSTVGELLSGSPIPEIRKLEVTETSKEVVITGRVSSFYIRQLAQESIRSMIAGRRLRNQVTVSTDKSPGVTELIGVPPEAKKDLHDDIREGLPYSALTKFVSKTQLPMAEVLGVIGLPSRTQARRKVERRLHADESDRLARLARIFDQTQNLFNGDVVAAGEWLLKPRPALGGARPLDLVTTDVGARRVEELIFKLTHGVLV